MKTQTITSVVDVVAGVFSFWESSVATALPPSHADGQADPDVADGRATGHRNVATTLSRSTTRISGFRNGSARAPLAGSDVHPARVAAADWLQRPLQAGGYPGRRRVDGNRWDREDIDSCGSCSQHLETDETLPTTRPARVITSAMNRHR